MSARLIVGVLKYQWSESEFLQLLKESTWTAQKKDMLLRLLSLRHDTPHWSFITQAKGDSHKRPARCLQVFKRFIIIIIITTTTILEGDTASMHGIQRMKKS